MCLLKLNDKRHYDLLCSLESLALEEASCHVTRTLNQPVTSLYEKETMFPTKSLHQLALHVSSTSGGGSPQPSKSMDLHGMYRVPVNIFLYPMRN